ncbi:MAG: serine hydrolase domain-containing protein [Alcanivorax sp.]
MRIFLTTFFLFTFSVPAYADFQEAADYSSKAEGIATVVMKDGKVVFEHYINGGAQDRKVELFSGTKSFSGVMAAAAVQDGLLTLDEKVSETIREWQDDPAKRDVTIRQVLSLTSGIDSPRPGRYPTYADAVRLGMEAKPGEHFEYAPGNFQIFGEVMQRKLSATMGGQYKNPVAYLQARVLDPLNIKPKNWDVGKDNMPILSMGADVSALEWARFGQFVLQGGQWKGKQLIDKQALEECFVGSEVNPAYGLTWWLNKTPSMHVLNKSLVMRRSTDLYAINKAKGLPTDMRMAAGHRNQRLYVIPSLNLVIVRLTDGERQGMVKRWGKKKGYEVEQTEVFMDTTFLRKALNL